MLKNKWLKFLLLYVGGVVVSLSQLKMVPVQNEVAQELGIKLSTVSWLMSIFTVSGIFLAIPGGALVTKIGPKKLLIGLMGCLFVGNILGYFASGFYFLLISRAIEGISFSMIIMVGIVFINFWFKNGNSGIATGLWGTFSALGSMLAMNIFKPLADAKGLKSLWLLIASLSLVLLVLYLFAMDSPDEKRDTEKEKNDTSLLKQAMKNKSVMMLAIAQGCMAFTLFAFINIYPLIYTQFYQLSESVANSYTGYFGLFGIPFGAVAGYLIDKTRKGQIIIIVSFVLMMLATLWTAYLGNTFSFIAQLFLLSAGASLSSSCVMILAPKTIHDQRLIGASISFINLFYYIGIFVGTPIVTKVSEVNNSWFLSILLLTGVGLIALLFVLGFVQQNKEKVL